MGRPVIFFLVLFFICCGAVEAAALVSHEPEGDPHTEEQLAYRRKMGRWRRDTQLVVRDDEFWVLLHVFSFTHKPLEHALNFVHSDHKFKYAAWVCGKSQEVLQEFSILLQKPHWCIRIEIHAAGCDTSALLELGVGLILLQHSSFKRRVHDLVSEFPSRALWLAHSSPNTSCQTRQAVAREVLHTQERNMCKLRARYDLKLGSLHPDALGQDRRGSGSIKKWSNVRPTAFKVLQAKWWASGGGRAPYQNHKGNQELEPMLLTFLKSVDALSHAVL